MSSNSWVPSVFPRGWAAVRLASLCDVVRGGSPRPMGDRRFFGGTIPFVKIADVTRSNRFTVRETETTVTQDGALRSRLIPAGRLILTNSATVCVPVFLGMDACIHDGFVAFDGLPDFVRQEYLYHFFKFIRPYVLDEHKQGVTQVNLNTGIVGEMVLLLPPPEEQRRIVIKIDELFSELDSGVGSISVAQKKLEAYRQCLLKHAFQGKLTADWTERSLVELESPALSVDPTHPPLPLGWDYIRLGEIIEEPTMALQSAVVMKTREPVFCASRISAMAESTPVT